jgi:hypothetical protein
LVVFIYLRQIKNTLSFFTQRWELCQLFLFFGLSSFFVFFWQGHLWMVFEKIKSEKRDNRNKTKKANTKISRKDWWSFVKQCVEREWFKTNKKFKSTHQKNESRKGENEKKKKKTRVSL